MCSGMSRKDQDLFAVAGRSLTKMRSISLARTMPTSFCRVYPDWRCRVALKLEEAG